MNNVTLYRDKYQVQFSDLKTWKEVEMKIYKEDADLAYDQVGALVGMMADDIMGIVGYNEEKLQMDILIDARVDIPENAPLKQIDVLDRYSVKINEKDFQSLLQGDYSNETEAQRADRSHRLNEILYNIIGVYPIDLTIFAGKGDTFEIIVGVKDGGMGPKGGSYNIDESDLVQKFVFEN